MNLPEQLFGIIYDKVDFLRFPSTRPKTFISSINRRLPQYDRWAFAVLIYHLKTLFNLGDEYLEIQKEGALEASKTSPGQDYFIMSDWIVQISLRLDLILRNDPFVLYHPLCKLDKLEISSQLARYVERQIEARSSTDIRARQGETHSDATIRNELTDALRREIKPPRGVKHALQRREELDIPQSIKYPITDAFERTRAIWCNTIDLSSHDILFKDFSKHQMLNLSNLPRWSIYDNRVHMNRRTLHVSSIWPQAFKVLLDVGAFLCFCKPVELVDEVRLVEEFLQPHVKVIKRSNRLSQQRMMGPTQSYVVEKNQYSEQD
jgi:hypothetical protein